MTGTGAAEPMAETAAPTAGAPALLRIDRLTRRFRGLVAVDQVSFTVARGSVHGLIGPNGAGKTTLFNLVSGLLAPDDGTILFDGRTGSGTGGATRLDRLPLQARAALGIARTFQNIRLFGEMTALENVMTGMHSHLAAPAAAILLRLKRFRREEAAAQARARALLAFVGLEDRAEAGAADLAYGDQRRLEIARALAAVPALLLLDEPAAGMNPAEKQALAALLRRVRDGGTTLLLVEHDMGFVMEVCDRITVLNFGRVIAEGLPRAVRADPAVIEAYLGARVAARLAAR